MANWVDETQRDQELFHKFGREHSPRTAVGQACRGMASSLPRRPFGMKQRVLPSGSAAIVADR